MMKMCWGVVLGLIVSACAACGEEPLGPVSPGEIQALQRAIARELNSNQMGSQILGDLYRLQQRLLSMQAAEAGGTAARAASAGGETQADILKRLEAEAATGSRIARRTLAFYYIHLNEPERALAIWRQMGRGNDYDLSYFIVSAYLELALGEYNEGRRNLETAIRLMDSRASIAVSAPVFCTNIAGYRLYEPRPAGNLLPGEDVLIYIELEGVDFESTADGMSECRVQFGLVLKDERGSTRWAEPNYGVYSPIYAGPIRDLHAALTWRAPNDLEPGHYTLSIEALEPESKRRGEGVVGFEVGRRETNPEKRPSAVLDPNNVPPGYYDPKSVYELQRQAAKAFPGAATPELPSLMNKSFDQNVYDILRQNERAQRVD